MKTRREYNKPEIEVIKIANTVILAGSPVNTDPSGEDWGEDEDEP